MPHGPRAARVLDGCASRVTSCDRRGGEGGATALWGLVFRVSGGGVCK